MKLLDLKFRFDNEMSESWVDYWLHSDTYKNHDWQSQPIGTSKSKSACAMSENDEVLCSVHLYRVRTEKVIFIRAYTQWK